MLHQCDSPWTLIIARQGVSVCMFILFIYFFVFTFKQWQKRGNERLRFCLTRIAVLKQEMHMSQNKMASHYSERWNIIYSTIRAAQSVQQKAAKEGERARGRGKKCANWLSKSILEQRSMIGFRHVVYLRCDSELFSRPSVSTALSGGQDNSRPKMPSYLDQLWESGVWTCDCS